MTIEFLLNGTTHRVEPRPDESFLETLRERGGITSLKDGCSPQGQCGCCVALVDGLPKTTCAMPARVANGKHIGTLDGLPAAERKQIADCFAATAGQQCGFCIPGIALRAKAITDRDPAPTREAIARALDVHLCRCTGCVKIVHAVQLLAAAKHGAPIPACTPSRPRPTFPANAGSACSTTTGLASSPSTRRCAASTTCSRLSPRTRRASTRRTRTCSSAPSSGAASAHLVSGTWATQRIEHLFLESESALAEPLPDGRLHLRTRGQGIFEDRRQVARFRGIAEDRIFVERVPNGGAFGGKVLERAAGHACGAYRVSAVDVESLAVYANNPPCGAMRGFGADQAHFAMEACVDLLAAKAGLDRWEIRWRNALSVGDTFCTGQVQEKSVGIRKTLQAVKPHYDAALRAGRAVGSACGVKNSGIGNGVEEWGKCRLVVEPDGSVTHYTGFNEMGQGLLTVLVQFAVEATGLPASVFVSKVDSTFNLQCGETTGSRGTLLSGNAVLAS
jgi:aerobic-type carbon monoxide dehydrogenase small subunit (CoxS/CutS family)